MAQREQPTLIRGARILSMVDGARETQGDVLVRSGLIAEIDQKIDCQDAQVIEARGGILLPGFVDNHRHVWQTQLRSTAGDWTLLNYLAEMRFVYSSFYSADDVYLGNYVGSLEALNAGITTVVDHCHILNSPDHSDEAVRGLEDAGGRAIFCYGIFSNPISHAPFVIEPDQGWRYADAQRLRAGRLSSADGRILMGLAPNEPEGAPFELSSADVRFAQDLGAHAISCHVAMGAYDAGNQFVRRLHEAGLLSSRLLFVHGSSLTDHELALIADAGAGISSTPETEMQMGMGFPVALRARKAGVRVGLGVDIVSNYAGDLFSQMRMMAQSARAQADARLQQRGKAPRHVEVSAREVLRLATLGGAESIHLADRVGSIECGKQADLILIRTDSINMCPTIDAVAATVFNANPSDVEMTMVAGRILKCDGRLQGIDWPALASRVEASSQRIIAKAAAVDRRMVEGITNSFYPNLA
jgi:cytosine/adenosine deaminase-related metal-dependent hydrolase